MAQSIKNRVFGSTVPKWLRDKIKKRQQGLHQAQSDGNELMN